VGYGCYYMLANALPTAELIFPTDSVTYLLKPAQLALLALKDSFLQVWSRFLGPVLLKLVKKRPTRLVLKALLLGSRAGRAFRAVCKHKGAGGGAVDKYIMLA